MLFEKAKKSDNWIIKLDFEFLEEKISRSFIEEFLFLKTLFLSSSILFLEGLAEFLDINKYTNDQYFPRTFLFCF